jgi:hypothetical protein
MSSKIKGVPYRSWAALNNHYTVIRQIAHFNAKTHLSELMMVSAN